MLLDLNKYLIDINVLDVIIRAFNDYSFVIK